MSFLENNDLDYQDLNQRSRKVLNTEAEDGETN